MRSTGNLSRNSTPVSPNGCLRDRVLVVRWPRRRSPEGCTMMEDLLWIGVMVGLFAASLLYIRLCEEA
jgi:hypothetical protein